MFKIDAIIVLLLLTTLADAELDQALENSYKLELIKLEEFTKSPGFIFLSNAAKMYNTNYQSNHFIRAPEALAKALKELVSGGTAGLDVAYGANVEGPCKKVVSLDTGYYAFLDGHPEIDEWHYQVEKLPLMWYKVANLCREQTREKVFKAFYSL